VKALAIKLGLSADDLLLVDEILSSGDKWDKLWLVRELLRRSR
jgi:hypothetical protein